MFNDGWYVCDFRDGKRDIWNFNVRRDNVYCKDVFKCVKFSKEYNWIIIGFIYKMRIIIIIFKSI